MSVLHCFPLLHTQTAQFQFTSSFSSSVLVSILHLMERSNGAARKNEEIPQSSPSFFIFILLLLLLLLLFNLQRSDPLLNVLLRVIFTRIRLCYLRLRLHIVWTLHTCTLKRTQTPTESVLIQIYGTSEGRFSSVNESTYHLSIQLVSD